MAFSMLNHERTTRLKQHKLFFGVRVLVCECVDVLRTWLECVLYVPVNMRNGCKSDFGVWHLVCTVRYLFVCMSRVSRIEEKKT